MSRAPAIQWCSDCKEYRPCRSISASEFWGGYAEDGHGHNFFKPNQDDIRFYRRFRKCEECGTEFQTAEIEMSHIDQLERLRDEAKKLRQAIKDMEIDMLSSETAMKDAVDKLANLRRLLEATKG